MTELTTAQKMAALVEAYRAAGPQDTELGSAWDMGNEWILVRADDKVMYVVRGPRLWYVGKASIGYASHADLVTAANQALAA